ARRRRRWWSDIAGGEGAGAATVAVTGALLGSGVGAGAGAGAGAAAARTVFEACGTNQIGRHVRRSPRVMPTTATMATATAAILPIRRASAGRPSRLRMAAFTVPT